MDIETKELALLPQAPVQRVAFFGTPVMAVPVLEALVDVGLDVALVVTRPDKKRGRGGSLIPSPVKVAAEQLGLTVTHEVADVVREHQRRSIDLGIVVAFGALIKRPILEVIPMVNVHVSLLPRWRGAAPIERAILAGDERTGVCLMQLEEGLDTGGVIDRREMLITPETTRDDIAAQLMSDGIEMLLDHIRSGSFVAHPQIGDVTYAHKIESGERRIDWSHSADQISRLIRIGDAWASFRGRRLKVHHAEIVPAHSLDLAARIGTLIVDAQGVYVVCGQGAIRLRRVQSEGRPQVDATDWARGIRLQMNEGFDHG
jgi:methionyl-tRNA formyltransferase